MSVNINTHFNTDCLKCEALEKVMANIGAFKMCFKCAEEEFHPLDESIEVGSDRYKKYRKWLDKYYKAAT